MVNEGRMDIREDGYGKADSDVEGNEKSLFTIIGAEQNYATVEKLATSPRFHRGHLGVRIPSVVPTIHNTTGLKTRQVSQRRRYWRQKSMSFGTSSLIQDNVG